MRYLSLFISLFLSLTFFAQKDSSKCLNSVNGIVVNKQNGEIMPNAIITLKNEGKIIKEIKADKSGHFSFNLNCDSRYQISAIYPNYTKNIKLIFTAKIPRSHTVKLELFPIEEFTKKNGKELILAESIYFIPDDYTLGKKEIATLNKVYDLLEKYRFLKIEIAFHSDSRGDQKFLQKLTQKRADVCARYLINKGIDPQRVIPKGYGASQLLNHCKPNVNCTNKEHLENRRTEFIVISNDNND